MNAHVYLLGNVSREGVSIATPLLHVTISWLLVAGLVVLAIACRRHAVKTRRAMRARQLARVGA